MKEPGMRGPGMQVLQDEWQQMSRHIDRVTAERDEARRWCTALVIVICITAMALGYVLAQGVI